MSGRLTVLQAVGAERCAVGAILLVCPAQVAARIAGGPRDLSPALVRMLGTRMLAQGLALLTKPTRRTALAAAAVDAAHLASMIVVAVTVPDYRRIAVRSGAESLAVMSGVGACMRWTR